MTPASGAAIPDSRCDICRRWKSETGVARRGGDCRPSLKGPTGHIGVVNLAGGRILDHDIIKSISENIFDGNDIPAGNRPTAIQSLKTPLFILA